MATLDAKGPFGGDVFKNPARYMYEKLERGENVDL